MTYAGWFALLLLACLCPAWARSDWVDGDVTEFQQPTNASPTYQGNPSGSTSSSLKGNVSHWSQNEVDDFLLGAGHPYFPSTLPPSTRGLPPTRWQHVNPGDFRAWLQLSNPSLVEKLDLINKNQIIEVKGKWDNAGHILHSFGIPSTQIGSKDLTEKLLAQTKVLIINCGARLSSENQSLIKSFVSKGGLLLTTDWALNDCISPCFPGYVKWSGEFSQVGVLNDAQIATKDARLVRSVLSPSYWKLEDKSQLVDVLNADVDVLVVSKTLAYDSAGSGILAFSFPYDKGQVLHLVGHFDNNSDYASANILPDPTPRTIVSMRQAIAANFIASAFDN